MSKLLPVVLVATALFLSQAERAQIAIAGTCAGRSCPPPPIGFIPGQRVDVQVTHLALEGARRASTPIKSPRSWD